MEYFEHPQLDALSTILSKVSIGSYVISGKVSAFHSNKLLLKKGNKKQTNGSVALEVSSPSADGIHGSYLQGEFTKIESDQSGFLNPIHSPSSTHKSVTRVRSNSLNTVIHPTPSSPTKLSLPSESILYFPKRPVRRRTSSLGDLNEPSSRALFLNLIYTLNETFPDYDFQFVKYEQFTEGDLSTIMKMMNQYLAEITLHYEDFLEQLWTMIDEIINLKTCEVFIYRPQLTDDQDFTYLWNFHVFFFNKSLYRIVYCTCHAKK